MSLKDLLDEEQDNIKKILEKYEEGKYDIEPLCKKYGITTETLKNYARKNGYSRKYTYKSNSIKSTINSNSYYLCPCFEKKNDEKIYCELAIFKPMEEPIPSSVEEWYNKKCNGQVLKCPYYYQELNREESKKNTAKEEKIKEPKNLEDLKNLLNRTCNIIDCVKKEKSKSKKKTKCKNAKKDN